MAILLFASFKALMVDLISVTHYKCGIALVHHLVEQLQEFLSPYHDSPPLQVGKT